jgi:hypothetical protein
MKLYKPQTLNSRPLYNPSLLNLSSMKKITNLLLALFCCVLFNHSLQAQTISTIPTFNNNNGSGLVTFNFQNTNAYPIEITQVATVLRSTGSSTFTIYYNTTPVSGPPGIISTTPAWIAAGTGVINSTIGSGTNQTEETVLTGISLVIPAGTTYGIAIGGFVTSSTTGSMGYYTIPATPATVTFSGGGCNLITGANISYGATASNVAASNTPRGFVGTLTFQPQVTITDNAGVANLISPMTDSFCSNSFKEVSVSVKNLGANALNSADINWSVDGVLQPFVPLPVSLPGYMDSVVVVLGEAHIPGIAPVAIRAWTSLPNGVSDNDNADDTLDASITAALQGVDVDIQPGDTTICQGTSIVLDAGAHNGNPIYIWNNGSLDQTRTVSDEGMYIVKVQTYQGCFDRDTVYISVYPDPVVNSIAVIQANGETFVFNVIGAQNITNYTWDFGDLTDTSGTGLPGEMTHTYAGPGEYTVTLTLSNACGEITVTRLVKIEGLGIADQSALQKEISLFPNPAKTGVTLSNKANIRMTALSITNVIGQVVYVDEHVNSAKTMVDISHLAPGMYTISVGTERGIVSKKLEVLP